MLYDAYWQLSIEHEVCDLLNMKILDTPQYTAHIQEDRQLQRVTQAPSNAQVPFLLTCKVREGI